MGREGYGGERRKQGRKEKETFEPLSENRSINAMFASRFADF